MATSEFYDTLAPYYHLIYADWEVSIGRQSRALDAIIRSTGGPQPRSVLDASCGIGTQSIGLAQLGYEVTMLMRLMEQAGFSEVRRIDGKLFEPVLVGCKRPERAQGGGTNERPHL